MKTGNEDTAAMPRCCFVELTAVTAVADDLRRSIIP
jgi:hypothetical protein